MKETKNITATNNGGSNILTQQNKTIKLAKMGMHQLYGFDEKDTKGMTEFADRTFGPYAGVAQQYLFYYMRTMNQ